MLTRCCPLSLRRTWAVLLPLLIFLDDLSADAWAKEPSSKLGTFRSLIVRPGEQLGRYLLQEEVQANDPSVEPRSLVTDTTEYPFSAIGILRLNLDYADSGYCTGALIAPTLVLTAAHCVHDPETGEDNQLNDFTPGYSPSSSPYPRASITAAYIMPEYTECPTGDTVCAHAYDIAIMVVDTSYSNWMGVGWNENMMNTTFNTAGYPGDHCLDDTIDSCQLYTETCRGVIPNNQATSQFDCLSYGGQSGSPIWSYEGGDQRIIRGVLTSGPAGGGDGLSASGYTIITQELYNNIDSIVANVQSGGG